MEREEHSTGDMENETRRGCHCLLCYVIGGDSLVTTRICKSAEQKVDNVYFTRVSQTIDKEIYS